MISLVRHNGHPVIVNADLIETVERSEERGTIVTLTTGNVLEVEGEPDAVLAAVVAYRQRINGRS
ncbi:MAG: hypothetical protein NVS2B3_06710 [Vulcanimicrobiaceae bacterium]